VESVVAAARIGLGLAEAYAHDDLLSDVRVGLAVGPVLVHDGDYFGPTVNLAHRIVTIANPGTVLMSDDVHEQLVREAPQELAGRALRPRVLKDLGRVQLWKCVRAVSGPVGDGTGGSGTDHRRGVRWDRLGDVLRDLEDLRDAGGRLLASSGRVLRGGRPGPGPAPSAGGQPEGGDPPGP
jgi:hypothetical protein